MPEIRPVPFSCPQYRLPGTVPLRRDRKGLANRATPQQYSNFGNGNGNVFKIYGDQGVIDLTHWTKPTYSTAGAIKPSQLSKEETLVKPVETLDHFLGWLQCLRSREACNAPIEAGYNHCVPALRAMRAFDTGRRQSYDLQKREIRAV